MNTLHQSNWTGLDCIVCFLLGAIAGLVTALFVWVMPV